MADDLLIGKKIEAMEINSFPPSLPIKGIVQSTYGNGTACVIDERGYIIRVRLDGARVVER